MSTHSTDGRPWAKLSELKPGDKLKADGGFDCIEEGAILEVKAEDDGELYVECDGPDGAYPGEGQHHSLEGQLSDEDGDSLVGFWLMERWEATRRAK